MKPLHSTNAADAHPLDPGSYDAAAYSWAFPEPGAPVPAVDDASFSANAPSHASPLLGHVIAVPEKEAYTPGSSSGAANSLQQPYPGMPADWDTLQQHAYARSIGKWSAFLCAMFVLVLAIGQFSLHRTVGPYVVLNVVCAVVFGAVAAAFLLAVDQRARSLGVGQAFYLFLIVCIVAGTPAGIYQLANNAQRVDSFCADRSGCTESERSTLLVFSYVIGCVGLALFFVLLTAFARLVFVFLCAVERAHGEAAGAAQLGRFVRASAHWLPNYPAMAASVREVFVMCASGAAQCSVAMSDCSVQTAMSALFVIVVAIIFLPVSTTVVSWHVHNLAGVVAFAAWIGVFIYLIVLCNGGNATACAAQLYLEYVIVVVLRCVSNKSN
jgi:hypothetical protein